jgi:hypothetical protein
MGIPRPKVFTGARWPPKPPRPAVGHRRRHAGRRLCSAFDCLIFEPNNSLRLIKEKGDPGSADEGTYSVDWSRNPYYLDIKWRGTPTGQTIMEFVEGGKLRIETGGETEGRPKAFTDKAIVFTKKEKAPAGSKQAKADADHDLGMAEFYRRTGHFGSAHFFYELVLYHYPDTDHAAEAKQRLEELKKYRIRRADGSEGWLEPQPQQPRTQPPPQVIIDAPAAHQEIRELRQQVKTLERRLEALEVKGKSQPRANVERDAPTATKEFRELTEQVRNAERRLAALEANGQEQADAERTARVGKIIVVGGNTKQTPVILEKMQLFPGEVLAYKALRRAETNLAAFQATIEVIDTDNSDYKDILIRIKKAPANREDNPHP